MLENGKILLILYFDAEICHFFSVFRMFDLHQVKIFKLQLVFIVI